MYIHAAIATYEVLFARLGWALSFHHAFFTLPAFCTLATATCCRFVLVMVEETPAGIALDEVRRVVEYRVYVVEVIAHACTAFTSSGSRLVSYEVPHFGQSITAIRLEP